MFAVRFLFTLALPLFLGYCVVAFLYKNKTNISFLERFALAWGIGIGLLGLEMFTISLFGFSLNLKIVSIPLAIIIIFLVSYLLYRKVKIIDLPAVKRIIKAIIEIKKEQNRWIVIAEKLLILLITIKISYVFFDALVKPILNFDDLWRQGSIAKIIFATGKVLSEQNIQLAGPHPYLNPLSQAWIYMGIGSWNDALGKIVFALCFTSLLFIFYTNLRKYTSRVYSLLFTYLLTSFPLIIYHAGTAYSDLMQTFYYSAGIIYLFQWINKREPPYLYTSALFLGIGNFVKQAGIPLWGAAIIVLFIYIIFEAKKELKTGGKFVLLSTIISSPWLFYQNSFLMRHAKFGSIFGKSAVTGAKASVVENLPYGNPTLTNIFHYLGKRMFTYADWQILWFVFIFVLICYWKRIIKSSLKYLLLIIILDLGLIIYAFSSPATYQYLVDGTLVNRIMMYQIPVVLFFIALLGKTSQE